jgi:hypothetical protein
MVFFMDITFHSAIEIPRYLQRFMDLLFVLLSLGCNWVWFCQFVCSNRIIHNWLQCTLLEYKSTMKRCSSMNLFDLVKDWELSFKHFEKLKKKTFTCVVCIKANIGHRSQLVLIQVLCKMWETEALQLPLCTISWTTHSAPAWLCQWCLTSDPQFLTQPWVGEKLTTKLVMIFSCRLEEHPTTTVCYYWAACVHLYHWNM